MELYRRIRPRSWTEMVGSVGTVKALEKEFSKDAPAQVFLLHGPSGTGKTTAARIAVSQLGINPMEIREINSSDNRGIDTAREIIETCRLQPFGGKRAYIIDECFHRDTLVKTPTGDRAISTLCTGDKVYSAAGITRVRDVKKNRVELERLCAVTLSSGATIFCSAEHLFFTNYGWVEAGRLGGFTNLVIVGYTMQNGKQRRIKSNGEKIQKDLRRLWGRVLRSFGKEQDLLKSLLSETEQYEKTTCAGLSGVWEGVSYTKQKPKILQSVLRVERQDASSRSTGRSLDRRNKKKNERGTHQVSANGGRGGSAKEAFRADETRKSDGRPCGGRESQGHQGQKGFSPCLERKTGRKRPLFCSANNAIRAVIRRLGIGICSMYKKSHARYTQQLQSRHWEPKDESGGRDRRQFTQQQTSKGKRQEERALSAAVRVESITLYKSGSDYRCFQGVVSDTERELGIIYLYDLEVVGHHSYFAEGCLVHNCHKASNDYMNAMLKPLEDVPEGTYFFLCTTDPQKLLPALRTRCSEYAFQALRPKEIMAVLKQSLASPEIPEDQRDVDPDVLAEICSIAQGSPRRAVKLLEKVLGIEDPDDAIDALSGGLEEESAEVRELCQALLKKEGWGKVKKLLKGLKTEDPEKLRRAVLGYMSAVLLNKQDQQAAIVLDEFAEPFWNMGFPGVVRACYLSLYSG